MTATLNGKAHLGPYRVMTLKEARQSILLAFQHLVNDYTVEDLPATVVVSIVPATPTLGEPEGEAPPQYDVTAIVQLNTVYFAD